MSVPLLNRDSTFEVYQVLNLPLLFPKPTPKLEAVARYKVEMEFFTLNIARMKFMLLTREEAQRCENDALGTCASASPIYVTGSHDLCVVELFRKNKKRIKDHCQVEILTEVMLPAAVSIADGV